MTWIDIITPDHADEALSRRYARLAAPDGQVDNILKAHSLRPHTLDAHMALYKSVLHHHANRVDKWFLEAAGVLVSALNRCAYCVLHHQAGLRRLLGDDKTSIDWIADLAVGRIPESMEPRHRTALDYVRLLTDSPADIDEARIERLRIVGWSDGAILELNQVAAYFAYANRTVLGLGVNSEGEKLGLSPSSEGADDWAHG